MIDDEPKKLTLRSVVQWLIAALGALLAFIGGQIVESLRGLHSEYGALMRDVNEQDKTVSGLQTQVNDLRKDADSLKERMDAHIDTEADTKRELRNWKK